MYDIWPISPLNPASPSNQLLYQSWAEGGEDGGYVATSCTPGAGCFGPGEALVFVMALALFAVVCVKVFGRD